MLVSSLLLQDQIENYQPFYKDIKFSRRRHEIASIEVVKSSRIDKHPTRSEPLETTRNSKQNISDKSKFYSKFGTKYII
jgi:hypothetical protein